MYIYKYILNVYRIPPHVYEVIWYMRWLRSVGSKKLQISSAEYRLFDRALCKKDL